MDFIKNVSIDSFKEFVNTHKSIITPVVAVAGFLCLSKLYVILTSPAKGSNLSLEASKEAATMLDESKEVVKKIGENHANDMSAQ